MTTDPAPPTDAEIAAFVEKTLASIAELPDDDPAAPETPRIARQAWARVKAKECTPEGYNGQFCPATEAMWYSCRRWLYIFLSKSFDPDLDLTAGPLPKWLWLAGQSGIGKSWLATKAYGFARRNAPTVINARIYRDIDSPFDTRLVTSAIVHWKDVMGAKRDPARTKYNALMDECRDVDLLLLDDIGGESRQSVIGEWEISDLEEIVDARARSRGKWTIFTSQKPVSAIAELSQRVSSRILRRTTDATRYEAAPFEEKQIELI